MMSSELQLKLTDLKRKKILKNAIVRKRMGIANFYKQNVKFENPDYIICIPVNGLNSSVIQDIRAEFLKCGLPVSQYTTKSFFSNLNKNNVLIKKNDLSQFYLGQMLVLKISLNTFSSVYNQMKCLRYLANYFNINNMKYVSLLYSSNISINLNNTTQKSVTHFVLQNIGQKLFHDLNLFSCFTENNLKKHPILFNNFNNNISYFISLLLYQIIFLLSILLLKTKKNI